MYEKNYTHFSVHDRPYQTQEPEDHIEDLCFWEQVLPKLNACQSLQKGYCPVNEREGAKQT